MSYKIVYFLFMLMIACTGCVARETALTATPNFATAILPTQPAQQPTLIIVPTESIATVAPTLASPIEGTTTTQINVRAEPSTASAALGIINIFAKVKIIGQDSTGSWYQIVHENSSGWVRAEFVQVNTQDKIPIVSAATRSASGIGALVTQKINVRGGAGTSFESLGALNPNDVVYVIGKDSSGAWAQVEFSSAPDGKGWAALEFLKIDNADALPIVGALETETPISAEGFSTAAQDGDSMQAPLTAVVFSPSSARSLQLNDDVSAPDGDAEDWIQFKPYARIIKIKIECSGAGLRIELWNDQRANDFFLACGSENFITVAPNSVYLLRLSSPDTGEVHYANYVLSMENMQ
ncbi:MAG: SH3 domain-containing protein [Anaerolineales bacterium]|nr:SH3 domain-containing protein [Anaerolineales bacterium]